MPWRSPARPASTRTSGRAAVRGAIDLTLVAGQLLGGLRGLTGEGYPDVVYDAMVVALSGRIVLDEPRRPGRGRVLVRRGDSQPPRTACPGGGAARYDVAYSG